MRSGRMPAATTRVFRRLSGFLRCGDPRRLRRGFRLRRILREAASRSEATRRVLPRPRSAPSLEPPHNCLRETIAIHPQASVACECEVVPRSQEEKNLSRNDSRGRNRGTGERASVKRRNPNGTRSIGLGTVAVVVVIVVAAMVGALAWLSRPNPYEPQANFNSNGGTGQPIDGIKCATSEQLLFHIHAHLDIFANGRKVRVPSQIGIPGKCIYWLHTHDSSGIIHVESPVQRTYTLGDFFDIWGAPLSRNKVLSFDVSRSEPLRVYVDGKLYKGDPRKVPIKEHEEIALVIGKMKGKPPASYEFPPGD